MHQSKKN